MSFKNNRDANFGVKISVRYRAADTARVHNKLGHATNPLVTVCTNLCAICNQWMCGQWEILLPKELQIQWNKRHFWLKITSEAIFNMQLCSPDVHPLIK